MQVTKGTREGFSEVRFESKPAESVREALKSAGFRWSGHNGCWYGRTDRLPADLPAAAPAPCPVRDRLAAEPSAEIRALRAELAELRALMATFKPVAVNVSTDGVATSSPVPVASVPVQSAPVAAVPKSTPVRSPSPVRPVTPVRSGTLGRTITVDAGKWA